METLQAAIEKARELIRHAGYMNSITLASKLVSAGYTGVPIDQVLAGIPCEDIHQVEYANSFSEYRVKDLFYYNPGAQHGT